MRAQVLESSPGHRAAPLASRELPVPEAGAGQVRVKVAACGVCRTDLHIVDGELPDPKLPLVIGHQVVGEVDALGLRVAAPDGMSGRSPRLEAVAPRPLAVGDRVGIPWLGWTCGQCRYCTSGRENLCPQARFTGYTIDGGFAEFAVADARYCFPIPEAFGDTEAAPLLCAGLIGYRSLARAGDGEWLGLYGFGAAAHIVLQLARHQGRRVAAFTRPGDQETQAFARRLGAEWAGGSDEVPPAQLDAAIIFAPVGALVPAALAAVAPGGRVVCAGIHMSDVPGFPYRLLWQERSVASVANLTRRDAEEFLPLAAAAGVRTTVHVYPLADANRALDDLRHGRFDGAAVLVP